ncbi:hypothetical protein [Nocardioides sp.]|uniref:hypothetical protein n=1 Tax=Nocardioides sp. TaxID=35761 RepID=UPI00286C1671|nr:hypothetical protein [Nocardioides sp.]
MNSILAWASAHKLAAGIIAFVLLAIIVGPFLPEDESVGEGAETSPRGKPARTESTEPEPTEATAVSPESNCIKLSPARTRTFGDGARPGVTIQGVAFGVPVEDEAFSGLSEGAALLLDGADYMAVAIRVQTSDDELQEAIVSSSLEEGGKGLVLASQSSLEFFNWGEFTKSGPAAEIRDSVANSKAAVAAVACLP